MIKITIFCGLLFCVLANLNAQSITVEVRSLNKNCKPVLLFSVVDSDTIAINSIGINVFKPDISFYGKDILLKYGENIFDLGNLDSIAKYIVFDYNKEASTECFVVTKVYGDAVLSNFNTKLSCKRGIHEIYLYNEIPPPQGKLPVRIKRKN